MPRYRVIRKSFLEVGDRRDAPYPRLVRPGEIIDYDGPPGRSLERLGDVEKKRVALDQKMASKPQGSTAELTVVNNRLDALELAVGRDKVEKAKADEEKRLADERKRLDEEEKKAKEDKEAAERKAAEDAEKADQKAKPSSTTTGASPSTTPFAQPATSERKTGEAEAAKG
jgi:hypothetical protein